MKKITSILFAILYVFLVSGSTLCFHYCGGRVASVGISVLGDKSEGCACGNMMKNSGCCKNQNINLTLKGEQKSSSATMAEIGFVQCLDLQFMPVYASPLSAISFSVISNYHSPPPKSGTSLLILNSVLRV